MTSPARGLRKFLTVFSVYMADSLTYRGQAVIWMLTDAVPAILLPLVWLASYGGRATIQGLSPGQMVTYYLVILCLKNLMISHAQWDIEFEIREGRFSAMLTRPFSYMAYHFAGSISWRLLRAVLFIPVFGVWLLVFHQYVRWEGYHLGWAFWLAVAGGHLLSFCLVYTLGLLALRFTEVRSLFLFYYMPASFLSGEVVPLALLPGAVEEAARYLPFRYTLSFAADLFLGRVPPDEVGFGLGMLAFWLVTVYLLSRLAWRWGLKHYTGVGM
ncbi:MAG: ABC transporter permease [Armatimonadota bacterium]